jgi:hypothetical protein
VAPGRDGSRFDFESARRNCCRLRPERPRCRDRVRVGRPFGSLFEARPTVGGGVRSPELSLAGLVHDVCSAVHPFARASPFFRSLPLDTHGLEWIEPPVMLAHPFDDGGSVAIDRSIARPSGLGTDGQAYHDFIGRSPTRGCDSRTRFSGRCGSPAIHFRWPASDLAPFDPRMPSPGRILPIGARAHCLRESRPMACCRSTVARRRLSVSCSTSWRTLPDG